jgi:hypothetical protein
MSEREGRPGRPVHCVQRHRQLASQQAPLSLQGGGADLTHSKTPGRERGLRSTAVRV